MLNLELQLWKSLGDIFRYLESDVRRLAGNPPHTINKPKTVILSSLDLRVHRLGFLSKLNFMFIMRPYDSDDSTRFVNVWARTIPSDAATSVASYVGRGRRTAAPGHSE